MLKIIRLEHGGLKIRMQTIDFIYLTFIFLFALCLASFMNVVIYRLPRNMNLAKPGSHCPNCNHPISWYDNIPIFSYLILGGKCRHCKVHIPIRYLIVELVTALIATFVFYKFFYVENNLILAICLGLTMIIFAGIFFIDMEFYIIPDSFNLILLVLGFVSFFANDLTRELLQIGFWDRIISIIISLFFWLLVPIIEKLIKKEIIGGGDLKLFTVVGLIIGWQLTLIGVLISSIVACVVEIPFKKIIKREITEDGKSAILPFGPYLVLGFIISIIFGLDLLNWYVSLLV